MIASVLLLALAAAPVNLCSLCHSDVRVQFERGVHHREGIACASCHGGNPAATTVAEAHRGDFRGVPRRRDIPALCASCHDDVRRMRPYNLSTDQFALYRTSQHGILLAKGDEKVAVCTDCHGVHEIRAHTDPESSVFLKNIPKTCGRCHGDAALIARYRLPGNAYADYSESVHGHAFLEPGNTTAPDCSRCHGAHGATPPGVGDIDKVCGQCHATARAYFIEGPHKRAMDAAGLPECASCHDHHRVLHADLGLLDSVCSNCHAKDSKEAEVATSMKTLFTQASEELDRARAMVDRAAAIPLYVQDDRARLEEAHTALLEASPVMHSLSVTHVEQLTNRSRSIANEVELEISGKLEQRKWRRVGLLVFWFYLLLTVAVLLRFRHRAAAEVSG
jgi:predicted CXXCH cytochrome family protein